MKNFILLSALAFIVSGCGYSAMGNEMIGQVKKVEHNTPLMCDKFDAADISLGVLRNGVGSMSAQDVWVTVPNQADFEILKKANETGDLVKIKYDERRVTFCIYDKIVLGVEVIHDK